MANVTLSQSLSMEKDLATPNFLSPSTFNSGSGSTSAFIRQYKRTGIANGWTNTLKMSYFDSFLEDAENLWFLHYTDKEENAQKVCLEIKNDFLKEFEI